jgi:hypothetical protein
MDRTQVDLSSVAREELRSEQAFPVSLKPLYGRCRFARRARLNFGRRRALDDFAIQTILEPQTGTRVMKYWFAATLLVGLALPALSIRAADGDKPLVNSPSTASDGADLAKLPDWGGIWIPKISDQDAQVRTNPPPWNPKAAALTAHQAAEEGAGRPPPLFVDCLPEGMPSWMLITHNALEFAFTPGRVTILGESDGNRLRRIYTDGRSHPEDPDPTFHGHSIGHWEGDTLVVDTIGVLPEVYVAVSEAVGVPNNGDMHITERIHLQDPNTLLDDLEITAPKVLTKPWQTTRIFLRRRGQKFDIVEGVCLQGLYAERVDDNGNAVFVPIPHQVGGNLVAPH